MQVEPLILSSPLLFDHHKNSLTFWTFKDFSMFCIPIFQMATSSDPLLVCQASCMKGIMIRRLGIKNQELTNIKKCPGRKTLKEPEL